MKKRSKELSLLKGQNADFKELLLESIRGMQTMGGALKGMPAPVYEPAYGKEKTKKLLSKKQIAALKKGRKALKEKRLSSK